MNEKNIISIQSLHQQIHKWIVMEFKGEVALDGVEYQKNVFFYVQFEDFEGIIKV